MMIKGYLSRNVIIYEDVVDFVRWQREEFWKRIKNIPRSGGRK
jgi:hypothetical protein